MMKKNFKEVTHEKLLADGISSYPQKNCFSPAITAKNKKFKQSI